MTPGRAVSATMRGPSTTIDSPGDAAAMARASAEAARTASTCGRTWSSNAMYVSAQVTMTSSVPSSSAYDSVRRPRSVRISGRE